MRDLTPPHNDAQRYYLDVTGRGYVTMVAAPCTSTEMVPERYGEWATGETGKTFQVTMMCGSRRYVVTIESHEEAAAELPQGAAI